MGNILGLLPTTDSGKVDFFNNLNIVSTFVLVLATAFALFASGMSIKFSKRLSKVQDQHVEAQDLQIKQLDKQIAEAQLAAKVQDKQIADAQEAAAIANNSAQKATERTANLEQRASEAEARAKRSESEIARANAASHDADARAASAQAEIAKANADVARAQARIAEAQKAAAQANQVAASERLARLQLEARLAPRTLSADQQQHLSKVLASFPQTSADIYVFEDTTDCRTLSETISNCLTSAGWVVHTGFVSNSGEIVRGVVIGIKPDSSKQTIDAGVELVSQLKSMGISAGSYDYNKMPISGVSFNSSIGAPSQIRIFVGSKP